jgi:DNA-binding PadR family transcriptional regulator
VSLEHILLGMLREPASGYDLKAAFEAGARHFWSAELSQIYPTLKQLEVRGWLKSRQQPSPRGPARRVYRRTAEGSRQLRKWVTQEPIVGSERFAYIGQLMSLGEVGDLAATEKFLGQLRKRLEAYLGLLESAEAGLRAAFPGFPDDLDEHEFHGLLSLRIGIRSLKAKVAACDENLSLVRARMQKESDHA